MRLYAEVVEHSSHGQGASERWVSVEIRGWNRQNPYAVGEADRRTAQEVANYVNWRLTGASSETT